MAYEESKEDRIKQGDILENVEHFVFSQQEKSLLKFVYPYTIVITQDCDLEQDYKARNVTLLQDKFLDSTLLIPAFLSQDFKMGTHLSMIDLKRQDWTTFSSKSDKWSNITGNENKRFHCLKQDDALGIPELIIDFKFFFTLPHSQLSSVYSKSYKASIKALYREDLSSRFSHYLSRIGLPTI